MQFVFKNSSANHARLLVLLTYCLCLPLPSAHVHTHSTLLCSLLHFYSSTYEATREDALFWRPVLCLRPQTCRSDELLRWGLAAGQTGLLCNRPEHFSSEPRVTGFPTCEHACTALYSTPPLTTHSHTHTQGEHNVLNLPHIWPWSRFSAAGSSDQSEPRNRVTWCA